MTMSVAETTDTQKSPSGQNVAFAKLLSGNDKKIRDRGLKKLKKWLSIKSLGDFEFVENDLMTIWIGLYYSMWMSDMPLVQEELAESLSALIHCFNKRTDAALLFIKCFNVTISRSWVTLDQYRIDKFAMLVRRFLRQSLVWLSNNDWSVPLVRQLMEIYSQHVLAEKTPLGFKSHFIEIFLEELSKVTEGELDPTPFIAILTPFVRTAATTQDGRVRLQLDVFFRHLIKQTDIALDYQDKFQAWGKAGFPGGDLNQMVPDTDEEDEGEDEAMDVEASEGPETNGALDPRAGSVHVTLHQLQLPIKRIIKVVKSHTMLPAATIKGKRLMLALTRHFRRLARGKYPFAVGKVAENVELDMKKLVDQTAKKILKSESKRKMKSLENKKLKRKMKRLSKAASTASEKVEATEEDDKVKAKEESPVSKKKPKVTTPEKEKPTVNSSTGSNRKRKASLVFSVSEEPNSKRSPDSKGQVPEPAELDLPLGWIVEEFEEFTPRSKKTVTDLWDVFPLKSDITAEDSPKTKTRGKEPKKDDTALLTTPPRAKVSGGKQTDSSPSSPKGSPKSSIKEKVSPGKENSPQNRSPVAKQAEPAESSETEIIVRSKKQSPPAFFTRAYAKAGVTPKTPLSLALSKQLEDVVGLTKSGRRISFNLAKNMAQEKVEYFEQLQRSPQIPFDSSRQPRHSALKAGLPPSPINPFYARKLKLSDH